MKKLFFLLSSLYALGLFSQSDPEYPTSPNWLYAITAPDVDYYEICESVIGPQSLIYKYGVGLLKSEDGGISWQTTNLVYTPAQNFNSIGHNLLAHPTDPNIYYALCDNRIF